MTDMRDMRLKRNLIEQQHLKARLTLGRGSFHLEKLHILPKIMLAGLRVSGLLARGQRNALDLVIKPVRFEFNALPEVFSGLTILHLSDIHVDGNPGLAERICERIQGLETDVCVMTGDYRYELHGPCNDVYRDMENILASVNARYGIVGILGNHDSAEMIPELERMGVKMLVNEAWEMRNGPESLWFIGVDDPHYYGCDDLPGALNGVPHDAFKILLVHSPELIEEAEEKGVNLYLCGHTHGGQIRLPIMGPLVVNANWSRRYVQGVWQYGNVRGYTSAGVGSAVLPVRFFCPPEIGLIELRRSDSPDSN